MVSSRRNGAGDDDTPPTVCASTRRHISVHRDVGKVQKLSHTMRKRALEVAVDKFQRHTIA